MSPAVPPLPEQRRPGDAGRRPRPFPKAAFAQDVGLSLVRERGPPRELLCVGRAGAEVLFLV